MGLGTKLCCRHLSPHLARGIPVQSLENLCVVGERFGRVERIGEEVRGRARDQGWERRTRGEREAESGRKQGQRWIKVKRDLESGARMAHPPSRD